MTQYSSFTLPGDGTPPTLPATFIALAFTPDGFNPMSDDASKRTTYWADSAGTLTADDVQLELNGLSYYQAAQIEALSVPYEAALQAPISYMGTTFDGDLQSQTIIAHAMLVYAVEGATPNDFFFADLSGNKVPMTLGQLQGLGSAVAENYLPVFKKWVDLKAQVMAATTLAEVQAVVWA
jgi:hypothetical protein